MDSENISGISSFGNYIDNYTRNQSINDNKAQQTVSNSTHKKNVSSASNKTLQNTMSPIDTDLLNQKYSDMQTTNPSYFSYNIPSPPVRSVNQLAKYEESVNSSSKQSPLKRKCVNVITYPFSKSRSQLFRIAMCLLFSVIICVVIFSVAFAVAANSKSSSTLSGNNTSSSNIVLVGYPPAGTPPPIKAEWTVNLDSVNLLNIPVRTNRNFPVPGNTNVKNFTDIVKCGKRNQWALTFEDGPGEYTLGLLDALRDIGVKATFFLVGAEIVKYTSVVQRMYNDGHEIGIQTWSHIGMTTLTNEQIIAELLWTAQAIKEVTGVVPLDFRPPFGDVDDRVRAIAKLLGLRVVLWNRDTMDWQGTVGVDPQLVTTWVFRNYTQWINEVKSSSSAAVSITPLSTSPTTANIGNAAIPTRTTRLARRQTTPDVSLGSISLQHDKFEVGARTGASAARLLKNAGLDVVAVYICAGFSTWKSNV
ncbi:chitin deacetylase [Nowakowskiella sp. JEL0407]|nr:chitin deacetylase [Nowakowskiella sp. JEL0407]